MANNLRKFNTYSDYEAAELVKPAVSLIAATDEVYFDQKDAPVPPTPTFSGLTVYYNITDISQPTELFNGGGSGSGSGSGSGGALPSAMIIDGTAVEVTNTYQFSTTGEHIVNYSFEDNQIPEYFLDGEGPARFSTVTKVEIGDTLTSIGTYAFIYCTGLTSVTIGNGVTSIGEEAFNQCYSLTSVTIGSGVTSIGNMAFYNCSSLTSIVIPDSVTSIGSGAFSHCSGLTSCTIGSGVTSIGGSAFGDCSGLTSMVVDSNNTVYDSRNNCNAIIETSTNALIQGFNNTSIPNSITSIGIYAFSRCSGMISIDIPNSVTSIGNYSFEYCSGLISIDIPDSVTSIGQDAFDFCSGLTSVTIGSGVTYINNWAFNGCSSLTSLTVNATTPPSLGNYGISLASTVVIYVPAASVSAYQTDWSRYASQIQAIQ